MALTPHRGLARGHAQGEDASPVHILGAVPVQIGCSEKEQKKDGSMRVWMQQGAATLPCRQASCVLKAQHVRVGILTAPRYTPS